MMMSVLFGLMHAARRQSLASMVQVDITLVGDDIDAAIMRQPQHRGHVLGLHHRAGRIVGRIQQNDFGARRDRALHHVGGQREIVPFVGGDVDRLAAGIAHDVFEGNPVGHRHNDFVAVIDQHLDGIEQGMLAADGGDAILALVVGAEVGSVALDDGVAQFGRAAYRRVLGEVVADGGDGRFLDVLGRGEMRLSRAQIDQVRAGRAKFIGFSGYRQSRGNFDALDPVGEKRSKLSSGSRHGLALHKRCLPVAEICLCA